MKPRPILNPENYRAEITVLKPHPCAVAVMELFQRRPRVLGVEHLIDDKGVVKTTRALVAPE